MTTPKKPTKQKTAPKKRVSSRMALISKAKSNIPLKKRIKTKPKPKPKSKQTPVPKPKSKPTPVVKPPKELKLPQEPVKPPELKSEPTNHGERLIPQRAPKYGKIGRPTKFVPEIKNKILEAIRLGLSTVKACNVAGIDYTTLSNWENKARREKLPEYIQFFEDCARAKDEREAFHLSQIIAASRSGTWQASAWFLERSLPQSYCLKSRMEITGKNGGPVQHDMRVTNTADILNALEIITIQENDIKMAPDRLTDGTSECEEDCAPNNG